LIGVAGDHILTVVRDFMKPLLSSAGLNKLLLNHENAIRSVTLALVVLWNNGSVLQAAQADPWTAARKHDAAIVLPDPKVLTAGGEKGSPPRYSYLSGAEVRSLANGPAPTLLMLAASGEGTLQTKEFRRLGILLAERGWKVVSLDLPCHGADRRKGEPAELAGWAARASVGEDIVLPFRQRADEVLRYLVTTGVADSNRIAVAGISRGGFMAFQAAAGNPLLRAVVAFAPVTDLLALREFAGQQKNEVAQRLALTNVADALADRASWLVIGNSDERVGTDKVVAFARALTNAARQRRLPPQVTLQIVPTPGHSSQPEWHDQAAAWLEDWAGEPKIKRRIPGSVDRPVRAQAGDVFGD
jgi:dienelactone hydrolase